jgi:transposase-like protein
VIVAGRDAYARGMSVRDIQAHLAEIYGTEVSPSPTSRVTDAVVDEVQLGRRDRSTLFGRS